MRHRRLGRTGIEVSEIGYGAWGIGGGMWQGVEDDESRRALRRAIELGVDFVDAALVYGDGHSERLVGDLVRERAERVHVATKVPPKNGVWPARAGVHADEAFPGEHVRACTERSLRNLGMEAVDLQQLHVWSDEWIGQGDWLETVEELRREGKIRHFGVSLNDHEPASGVRLVETGIVDTVQVIYNVFNQSHEDELFPACRRHDVGVIVRVPLDEGGLTGRIEPETKFERGDFRARYFRGERRREVHERVTALAEDLRVGRDEVAALALRFVLSHPAVSTVIPGMRSVRNVERNVALSDGAGLPAERRERLRAHRWPRNFYL